MTEHVAAQDPHIHEPKGASTAAEGSVYVSDGAGGGSWKTASVVNVVNQGVYNYQDVTTQSSPIALTVVDDEYELTNDAAGAQTQEFPLDGLDKMWDESTDRFIWTDGDVLALGDTVEIRMDIEVSTVAVNTAITVELELDVGGLNVRIPMLTSVNFKSSGTYKQIRWMGIYMGANEVLNGPARILASSDSTGASIKVNGWYIRASHTTEGVIVYG